MERIIIEVPDENDSFSKVTLSGGQYLIRFTYNDTGGFWTFGLYTLQREAIAGGIKIIPEFPLNLYLSEPRFPLGLFVASTKKNRIGRNSFQDGSAVFSYYTIH